MTMKIALGLFGVQDILGNGVSSLIDTAVAAEKAGIDQLVMTDHVIMGADTSAYPFGDFPVPAEYPWYEPLTMLTAIAAVTQTIHLSTGVIITPLRPVALLAKTTATLDQIAQGRLGLGIGVGWQKAEYDAQNANFDKRWNLFDEQIMALKSLWSELPSNFNGEQLHFNELYSAPQPKSKIPLLYGVAPTDKNCKRIAELGDGWIPIKRDPQWIKAGVEKLKQAFIDAGRHPDELIVRAQCPVAFDENGLGILEKSLDHIPEMLEAGVTDFEFMACVFVHQAEKMDEFLSTIAEIKTRHDH